MTEILLTALKWFNQIAVVFLLQSTVVLLLGLTIAKIAKRHGSLIQAAIFRATFIGVCASPILAIALSWLGVSGFALNLPIGTEISEFVPASIQSNNSGDWINGDAITESIPFDSTVRREPVDLPASTAAGQGVADGLAMSPIPSDSQLKTVANSTVRSNSSWNSLVLFVVPAIWLVGSFCLLAKLLLELRCVRKLCNSSVAVTESVKQRVEKLSAALRIKVPKVAFHDLIASPCVTGFWSPLVLLPIDVQDPAAQEKSMIHELAHLSRGDVKWNFVQRIALAVLFPQPFLWRLVYRMEAVAEDVCDDFVVKYTHDRTGYAQQLVDLAESQQVLPNIAGLGMFSSSRSVLYSRVERILDASRQLSIRLNRQSIVLVFIVLGALSVVGSFFRHQSSIGPSISSDKLQSVPEPENEIGAVFQEDDDKHAPEQIEVRGVVCDAKGQPAPNVELVVDWLHGEKKVQSDSKGEYWVLVPKNTNFLQIRAFADGRLSQGIFMQHQSLTQDVEIPIDLAPVRIINVRVIDNAGAAVEGATVTAISSEQNVAHRRRRMDTSVSDAQGNASLLVPIQMPIENVVAVKPGQGIDYQPARFGDKLAFPTEKPVTFPPTPYVLKLTGIKPVTISVQSDYGTPLPNAKVKISSIAPKPDNPPALDSDAIGDFEFVTDEKGNVELNVLPDWCTRAHLRAEIAGYATHHNEEYNPKFHGGKITIHASKLVPVSGTVFDENNLPVPGLNLEFDSQGSRIDRNTGFHHRKSATTDADGKFRVELPEDTGCMAISATDRIALKNAEPFVIEAGKPVPDQVYRTCQATRIFGRVTAGPDRKPVSTCDVLFLRRAEVDNVPIPNAKIGNYRATLNRQSSTVSQSDGQFEIFADPGDYLVLAPRERIGNEQIFSINDENEFECNIHLEKYGMTTLRGQIVCNDPGVSLQGLRVLWQYLEQVSDFADRDTQTAKDGSFEFERASHRILAYIETPDRRHAGFVVMEPDDKEAKIALRPTVGASGIVIDAQSGNPLANSEFQICHQIRYGQLTTSINFPRTIMTDANGQFQASGLAVGLKYTIQQVFRGNRHPNDMSWRDVHEFTPDETEQIDLGVIRVPENFRQLSDGEMLDQRIAQIFEDKKPVADRLKRALENANYSNQHVAVLVGDPRSKPIRDLIESTLQNRELLRVLQDYVLRGVSLPMNEETRATLAKANVIVASEDASPISLFVIDSEGQLLDQFSDRDLLLDGEFKPNGLIGVLQKHSLKPIDAKDVLETALAKAKQENKRLIVQQTATWCAPCWTLSQYFEKTRSIWEKDYVWVKIDNRWTDAIELMQEFRNGSSGGIPWFAILDADRKILATSNDADGENVGYPSDAKSKSHFRKMIQTTATRLTESEIDLLMSGFEDK